VNDIKITDSGDIEIDAGSGDIATTGAISYKTDLNEANTVSQLALMAVKTEKGDFITHPELGSSLHTMLGYPNKPSTAALGESFIRNAIRAHGVANKITVESWPTDLNTIAYEVKIAVGAPNRMLTFTLTQALDNAPVTEE